MELITQREGKIITTVLVWVIRLSQRTAIASSIYFIWAAYQQGMKKSGRYSLVSCSSFILGQTLVFFQPL
jgi:hypothetical protein